MVASAFCGFPIEVKSRKWGVLVLDSREPDAHIAPDTEQEANNFEMAAYIIGKMLERW